MKKINTKGFTLIELLAVITIMGILMLVAIPAVSRTIENSRRDTFMNTAKSYASAIQNSVASDEIKCYDGGTTLTLASALTAGDGQANAVKYAYYFDSSQNSGTDLMESGGKSSWGNAEVSGYVVFGKYTVSVGSEGLKTTHYDYYVSMADGNHGIANPVKLEDLARSHVHVAGVSKVTAPAESAKTATIGTENIPLCIIA